MPYPIYKQHDAMDCGPTCLRMVAKFHGKNYSLEYLRDRSYITRMGVSLQGISEAAEHIGMRTLGVKVTYEKLLEEAPLPCVLHWSQNHFVVLYKVSNPSIFSRKRKFTIGDPAVGIIKLNEDDFKKYWISDSKDRGVALLLETTPAFFESEQKGDDKKGSFSFFFQYLRPHSAFLMQLILGMVLGSLLELIFPFLTQSLVDTGINNQNIGFVNIILLSQVMLFIGKTAVEMIRSWILLHVSTRINISIISDFIQKLMKLPLSFFDTKLIGDITQRISDHKRIESFMTTSTLSTLFSMVNLVIFSCVMAYYNIPVLIVFLVGSILSVAWILFFMRWRKDLDYARFARVSENQNTIYEMISGMPDIKLSNAERQQRWEWERIQAKIFQLSVRGLALGQWQMAGTRFIDQLKNIFISFLCATAVIKGNMTLGMMMSVSYIIGQMSGPVSQLLDFFRSGQDASISLDRLREVHEREDETPAIARKILPFNEDISATGDLRVDKVSFQYEGPSSPFVLKDLNLTIPQGKVTAIVGSSGSGKTTLLKMLLKFYNPQKGTFLLAHQNLADIPSDLWRSKCGVVMQDGYLFGKTIAENIAFGFDKIDVKRLKHAVHVANIQEFIEEMPLGYNTKIGNSGSGVSQGQKQRLLIARAVYKDPDFLFFDEATSALDANNERTIMTNLEEFFKGKTVVVVAHRLSTVKNADKIVVLEKGTIIEEGTHEELTAQRGAYYHLVKNQLELGS